MVAHIIYIDSIQTISVGPTRVDLYIHDIRLRRIYFHSNLLIRCSVLTAESWGIPDIRWPTKLLSLPLDKCHFTPFSFGDIKSVPFKVPFHSFLQHRYYPSCPLSSSLKGTDLISPNEKGGSIPYVRLACYELRLRSYSGFDTPLGWIWIV